MKVGVIGCGNVGSILAERQTSFEIVAAYDSLPERVAAFSDKYGAKQFSDIDVFLQEPLDIVVEVASIDAVKDLAEKVLFAGRDLILLSVGALANDAFREELLATAKHPFIAGSIFHPEPLWVWIMSVSGKYPGLISFF